MHKQVNIQRLENIDDLDLLIKGDAVPIIYQFEPKSYNKDKEKIGAYHGKSSTGQFEFIISAFLGGEYLIRHMVEKCSLIVQNGKIVINEDKSATKSFSQGDYEYPELNRTLIIAGLR